MVTQEGYLGLRERFILETETDYGTAISLTTAYVPGVDYKVTPNFTQGFQEKLNTGQDVRTIAGKEAGPLGLQYDLEYSATNWRMLQYVFDVDSETGADPYTHTLSVGNTLKSFTSEWAMRHSSDPQIFKLVGNVINTFSIDFQKSSGEGNDGFVKCKASCIAQNYTTPDLQAGSFTTSEAPFQYRHLAVTLVSSAVIPINNGNLTFEQGITPNDSRYASTTLGRTIGTPIAQTFRISGRFNLNLYETTFLSLWELATALTGTNTIVFEQSASNKVTFTLTGMYVEPVPTAGTNTEGINTGDFVFTATGVTTVAIDSIENY